MAETRHNWIDRAIDYVAPIYAARRAKARMFAAAANSYVGASRSKRSLASWNPRAGSADDALVWDLPTLRDRSHDLMRNTPLARGAVNTTVTNVVGPGLKLQARIDRAALGMDDEQAEEWEAHAEREWRLFSERTEIDITRTSTFAELQELAFRSTLVGGDAFAILTNLRRTGSPYNTKIQLIEGARVTTPNDRQLTTTMVDGVEKDPETGAPVAYHIANHYPQGSLLPGLKPAWVRVPAFGDKTGRRNVLHLYKRIRMDQSRGEPYLAPVIDLCKTLDRYSEAEVMAALTQSLLTVFIKSDLGDAGLGPMLPTSETGASSSDDDIKLGSGAVVGLAPGEDISAVNPTHPNATFDPFVMSLCRQMGVALELPYEVLVKHFTASYSAARAALLEAWKFFLGRRIWLARTFCQPVYEAFLWEAVATGRITAPGFFSDELARMAYCGACWIGPAKGMINELDEVKAARERLDAGLSTLDEETAQLTGGDWEQNHQQQVKERKARKEAELDPEDVQAETRQTTVPNDAEDLA